MIGGLFTMRASGQSSWWPSIRNGIISAVIAPFVVIAAIFVYNFVIGYQLDQYIKINNRLTAIDTAMSRLTQLEGQEVRESDQLRSLRRLIYLERCRQLVGTIDQNLDSIKKDAHKEIGMPPPPLGVRPSVYLATADWSDKINQLDVVAKQCPHDNQISLEKEPAAAQMDMLSPDEPAHADIDQRHRLRRLYWQSVSARRVIDNIKSTINSEMAEMEDVIVRDFGGQ
jgi:flagellar biosynthesis component FlhA